MTGPQRKSLAAPRYDGGTTRLEHQDGYRGCSDLSGVWRHDVREMRTWVTAGELTCSTQR